MHDILTIGAITRDIFIKPRQFAQVPAGRFCPLDDPQCQPKICLVQGDKIEIEDFQRQLGGGAANTGVGFSRLGLKTAVLGMTGKDEEAEEIIGGLTKEGVATTYIQKNKTTHTNFSIILLGDGGQTILAYRGKKNYSSLKIPRRKIAPWVYLAPLGSGFEDLLKELVKYAAENSLILVHNPSKIEIEERREILALLRVTKILILNHEEALLLAGLAGPSTLIEILKKLASFGPEIVVITQGKKGAAAISGDFAWQIAGYPAQLVDSTGAGDAFACAFTTAINRGEPLEVALKWGAVNSALATEKIGAQAGLCLLAKIEQELKKHPNLLKISRL